jgi:hypothetical protein
MVVLAIRLSRPQMFLDPTPERQVSLLAVHRFGKMYNAGPPVNIIPAYIQKFTSYHRQTLLQVGPSDPIEACQDFNAF